MINASIDMLNHLGHKEHARVIQEATYETIVDKAIRTPGKLEMIVFRNFTKETSLTVFCKPMCFFFIKSFSKTNNLRNRTV